MIFHFPDYDTLKLALTSGVVPTDVSLKPAAFGVDEAQRPWLEPSVKPPRRMGAELTRLGVANPRAYPSPGENLGNWLQALPLQRQENLPELGSSTPVLFELSDANQLPEVVGEMLRLGVDRQGFRWMKDEEIGRAHV